MVSTLNRRLYVQNLETGEFDYSNPKYIILKNSTNIDYDDETGEPIKRFCTKTNNFHIPKEILNKTSNHSIKKKKRILRHCQNTYTLTNKEKYISLKKKIILGYSKTSHRMFLIPSLFFFTKFTALFLTISEIYLHIWAHRKNYRNKNPNIYYRSPLHLLTSQFCAICRSQSESIYINKIQRKTRILFALSKKL